MCAFEGDGRTGRRRSTAGWYSLQSKKYSGTEGKLDVKEPIYKYIPPPRYKTRPPATALLEQTC